jgi:hypothetical protein
MAFRVFVGRWVRGGFLEIDLWLIGNTAGICALAWISGFD